MKKLVSQTPEQILADAKATRSSGRVLFGALGCLIGIFFFGVWLFGQVVTGHQEKIFRFPDYWQACWEWPDPSAAPVKGLTWAQLECRLYREGNPNGRYDQSIRKAQHAHLLPIQADGNIAYRPLYATSPLGFVALPLGFIALSFTLGLAYGWRKDHRYTRALKGLGVYVDGSLMVDIKTYQAQNGGHDLTYYVYAREGKRAEYL